MWSLEAGRIMALRFPMGGRQYGHRGRFRLWPIILFGLFGVFYYFSNQETVPVTGRSQLVSMDRQQEMALGVASYREVLAKSDVVSSGKAVELVREIGQRIAKAAAADDPGFKWEYSVIRSDQANAFALPGGKVAIYTGILPVAENADGLAVIMGHEIAHAIARHGAERMAQQQLLQWGQLAVGMAAGELDRQTQQMVMGAFGLGAQYGALLPFSRKHESEADYIGLIYVARACFDPREAPKLWQRMAKAPSGRGQPAEFMSTHPSPDTRIRQFEEWMPEALEVRRKSCGG
jgi:predicted Zn-dependent protease